MSLRLAPTVTVPACLPVVPGLYYQSQMNEPLGAASLDYRLVAGSLYAVPFWCVEPAVATSLNLDIWVVALNTRLRLGIYRDLDGAPGALVLDAGEFDDALTGVHTKVISQALAPAIYWLACFAEGAAGVAYTGRRNAMLLGWDSPAATDIVEVDGFRATYGGVEADPAVPYGVLPDPFPDHRLGCTLTGSAGNVRSFAPRLMIGF